MPLRLDIKRKLSSRSDRVKSVDIHPVEPWVLSAMYNGHVFLWNYNTQSLVKSFEVSDQPVRAGKFVTRKQWIVAGSDDMQVRVYNYNTMEKVKTFEAHSDYIRCIAVHPTLSLLLTSSDDMTIRLWDWEKAWGNTMTFEGHSHYVMMVAFNPKDANTFASASLDRTIKVWGLNTLQPHFTLEGHEKGVNCVEYFSGGDRPYLVSGADDRTVKVRAFLESGAAARRPPPRSAAAATAARAVRAAAERGRRSPPAPPAARRCGITRRSSACRRWRGTRTTWRACAATPSSPSS